MLNFPQWYLPIKSKLITCPHTEVILKRTVWPWKLPVYSCTEHAPLRPLRLVQLPFDQKEQLRKYLRNATWKCRRFIWNQGKLTQKRQGINYFETFVLLSSYFTREGGQTTDIADFCHAQICAKSMRLILSHTGYWIIHSNNCEKSKPRKGINKSVGFWSNF